MPSSSSAGTRLRRLIALLGTLVLLPLAVVLAATPAQSADTPTLTGTVTDGLDELLPGADVQAVDAATLDDIPDAGAHAVTDGTGAYSLDLATGTYKIRYSKDGYTPDWYGGEDALVITVDGDGVVSIDGETIDDGDLGPVSLNSTATHTISGTAVKAVGQPLTGIVVDVYTSDDHEEIVRSATTSSDGTFSLTLPVGVYHVRLSDPAHHYLPRWHGADPGDTPSDVTLSSNQPLGTITLAPVPAGGEFPIAGRIVDANGDSVNGVDVAVAVAEGSGDSGADTTSGEGSYSVSVLPGTYRVTFSGEGFSALQYGVDGGSSTVTVAADGTLSTAPAEVLADNQLSTFTLPSTAHGKTGTVHAADGGAPVGGMTVRAFPDGSSDLAEVVDTATTASDGTYTLDLPIGTYDVQVVDLDVAAPNYQPTWIGGATPVEVKIAQGGALTVGGTSVDSLPDVELSVATDTTAYDITGAVVDVNGDPIPSTTVVAAPQTGTAPENEASTTTDAAGHYVLAVKAGTYRITYAATDFNTATYSGTDTAPVDVVVSGTGTVTAGTIEAPGGALQEVELTGTATYQVTGTIQDATDNAAIGSIHVAVHPTDDPTVTAGTAVTNGSGGYTVPGLRVGTYTLDFTDIDGTEGTGVQYVGASYGGSPPLEVKIARGGGAIVSNAAMTGNNLGITKLARASSTTTYAVSGDVSDANGDVIVGATVTALPQGVTPGGNQVAQTTDSNGHYVLALKTGTYRIRYVAASFTTTHYSNDADPPVVVDVMVNSDGSVTAGGVAVPNRELEGVTLVGTVTHTISGTVKNSGGTPVSGLTVKLYSADDNSSAIDTTTTNGSGGYSFGGRVIGTYLIEVVGAPEYVNAWYLSSQTSAAATEVKIGQGSTIYSGGSPTSPNGTLSAMNLSAVTVNSQFAVSGDVDDANGDGIVGLTVTAQAVSGGQTETDVTDVEGHFDFGIGSESGLKAGTYQITVAGNADFGPGFLTSDDETRSSVVVSSLGVTVDGEAQADGAVGSITLAGLKNYAVTGTATNGSSGLPGITVEAFESGTSTTVATTTTGGGGSFGVSLKVGTYTVRFTDNTSNATRYQQTYFGGELAKEVKVGQGGFVTVDGAVVPIAATMATVTADTTYPLKGTVSEPVNFDPLNGVTVTAVPVSGTPATNWRQGTTGPDAVLDAAGVYRIPVKPGKYRLRFEKAGYEPGYLINYDPDVPVPAIITVGVTGTINAPGLELTDGIIDDYTMLFPAAAFRTAPKLSDKVAVAQTVTTTIGALQGASIDNELVYIEWFLNGKPADDYSTGGLYRKFEVPAVAAGKKLSYRVTIEDPDSVRAASVFNSRPVLVRKAATKLRGAFKKGRLTVTLALLKETVSKDALPKLTGKILVKDGRKTVATVKLKAKSKGKAVVKKLTRLKAGKHKLTLVYTGAKGINATKTKIKVKI